MVRDTHFDRFFRQKSRPSMTTGSPSPSHATKKSEKRPTSTVKRQESTNEIPEQVLGALAEYKRRQYTRRWRLYDLSVDGVRVFVEEKKATYEEDAKLEVRSAKEVLAVWLALAAACVSAAAVDASACMTILLAIGLPFVWVVMGPPHRPHYTSPQSEFDLRPWRLTGRVRASVLIYRSPETVFNVVREGSAVVRRESEWSLEFEHGSLVESIDSHTDIVDVVEKCVVSACETTISAIIRKLLCFHSRSSRLMRYWRHDEDGGYTFVTQSVANNPSFKQYDIDSNIVNQEVNGCVMELRPSTTKDSVVVSEAADVDSKLSWFSALYCWGDTPSWLTLSHDSNVAVAFHAHRITLRLRGLKSYAMQLENNFKPSSIQLTNLSATSPAAAPLRKKAVATGAQAELVRSDELSPRHNKKHSSRSSSSFGNTKRSNSERSEEDSSNGEGHRPSGGASSAGASKPNARKISENELFGFLSPHFKRTTVPYDTNAFQELPPENFNVRGPHYLEDGKKVACARSACRLVNIGTLRSQQPLENLISFPNHNVAGEFPDGIVVNFVMPHDGSAYVAFLFYFVDLKEDPAFSRRLREFALEMTDAERNEHLKLIPFIYEGPWIARHALGSRPTLLGRNIHTKYHVRRGDNDSFVIECDVDVTSGPGANSAWRIMRGVAKSIVVDLAFLFESKKQADLPETLIGAGRIQHFDFAKHDNPAVTDVEEPPKRDGDAGAPSPTSTS